MNINKFGRLWEDYYPLIMACLAFIVYWLFFPPLHNGAKYGEFLSAMVSAVSILAGFITTAKAIFFSLNNSKIAMLKGTPHFARMAGFFHTCIKYMLCLVFLSLLLIYLSGITSENIKCIDSIKNYGDSILVFLFVGSAFSLYRSLGLFELIVIDE